MMSDTVVGALIGGLLALAGVAGTAWITMRALKRQQEHEERVRVRETRLEAYDALIRTGDDCFFAILRLIVLDAMTTAELQEYRRISAAFRQAAQRVTLVAPRETGVLAMTFHYTTLQLVGARDHPEKKDELQERAIVARNEFWLAARRDLEFDEEDVAGASALPPLPDPVAARTLT